MTALRAAVIGLGVGEQHILGYAAHPLCEVVAVCDIDPAKLAMAAERYPTLRRTADPRAVLDDPDVDVVSVASYDDVHAAQIQHALERGKHVFAEKPLCLSEEDARVIRALLRARPELRLSTNVPLRRSPRFVEVRERIARGELGELFHLEGDYDYGRRHKLTHGWRGTLPSYSVTLGGAIHLIDLLRWMSGLEPVEVTSALAGGIATRGSRFAPPDFTLATLRLTGGATAKVTANFGCVSPHFHGVRVYGTEGTFVNGLPDGVLYTQTDGPVEARVTPVRAPYPGVGKSVLIGSFLDEILTGVPSEVPVDEVFATLAVCFAIERALVSGRPEPIKKF